MSTQEYKVQLDVFEGPLDLLLYLIRKDEVEITDIPIGTITNQYMEYLSLMRLLDLDIAGEFIVMAATLMMIKSRMLLPVEERVIDDDEEEDDPRWDLVRQLVEYKKFKDAALHLHIMELDREHVYDREGANIQLEKDADKSLQDVSIFDLISAFNEALQNVPQESLTEIFAEEFTVAQKIDDVMKRMKDNHRVSISEVFSQMRSRSEVVCTFLAVLELIKLKHIAIVQEEVFGEIIIERHEDESGL
jgi:segregation and condensation protein A